MQLILAEFVAGAAFVYTVRTADTKADKRADKLDSRIDKLDSRIDRLESRMQSMHSELITRVDRIADAQAQFYNILGEHKGKIEMLEKR